MYTHSEPTHAIPRNDFPATNIRILNIEDSPADSELIRLQLERDGIACELQRVENELEVTHALSRLAFDLVISDFTLPSFDGQRALEIARKLSPQTPFIFFSGTLGEEAAIASLRNGAADYVLKQQPARLPTAVRRALQEAAVQRERTEAMDALSHNAAQLRLIAETVDEALWIVNTEAGSLLYLSPGYQRIWGKEWEPAAEILHSFPDRLCDADQSEVLAEREAKRWHDELDQTYRISDCTGITKWIWERGFPVRDASGHVTHYVGVAKDITQSKYLEDALRQTQVELDLKNKIASIFLTAPGSSMFGDVLRMVVEVTQSEDGLFGYIDEGGALVCSELLPGHRQPQAADRFPRDHWIGIWEALVKKRSVCMNNVSAFLPLAHIPIHRLLIAPIPYKDEIIGHFVVANKATDYVDKDLRLLEHIAVYVAPVLKVRLQRDAHEKELTKALGAKEVLLQELHHRVKNNLQIISSMLSMQANSAPEPVRATLRDSQTRVSAMALVHEQLHAEGNPAELDFANYAKKLTTTLWNAYQAEAIQLRFAVHAVRLSIHQAIPCGLILNELVTNALKYAFPASGKGTILVSLHTTEEGEIKLEVSDNGVGLPQGFSWKQANSLGFQIIAALAQQLHATLDFQTESGVACTLIFPKEQRQVESARYAA